MWCGDTHFPAMDSSACTFETQTFHWIFLMQCWGGVITTLKFHTFFSVAVVLLICFSASPVHYLSLPAALRYIHSNSFQLFQIITLLERTLLISLPECLKDPLHASVVNCYRLGQTFLLKWKKWLLQETLEIFHIVYNKCKKNVFEGSLNVSKKSNQIPTFHC